MNFVKVEENKSVMTISLNRPELRNAFNPQMIEEIRSAFAGASSRSNLKLIVFRGEGKSFCAGGDLNWMQEMVRYTHAQNLSDSKALYEMFNAIQNCAVPVLGVVHGAAFGGALGLLAVCDQVIAEEKTQFCFSEVKLGIAPAVISSFILKKTTLGSVMPYMLNASIFGAKQAQQMGLVHLVSDSESLNDHVETTIQSYMQTGPQAVRATKKLLQSLSSLDATSAKEKTCELIAELRTGQEGQEGLKAFLEKREPTWRIHE